MRTMLRTLRCWMIVVLLGFLGQVALGESVATMPAPTGYVSDLAGLLTPETKASLEELCTEVDHQAHAQIAVVTVKSLEADPVKNQKASDALPAPSIEEFTTALEDKWKVGAKGTDRGILLIVSLNPRKYRIEVGYGLEGILNDAKVGDIGREMAPLLHSGDYNQAIPLGTREIAQDIAADAGVALSGADAPVQRIYREQPAQPQVSPIGALIVGVILMVVIGVLIRTGHIGLLFFLLFNLLGGGGGGRDDDDRGGGFGGGGGGFGGFGGGSSGGGGASGDF
ncbi:MAG: TPM domain-containing protein [Acidobacteriaceae bacterium]|nr:TPM domain-containing protein [Acidobacteriaceae bacterium]